MASINEEIKQKKFRNEYSKLAVNIIYTNSWLNTQQNPLFKRHGLTPQQYNVLRILRGQGDSAATVNLVKERMIDKMSNVSRIIDKLKAKDLVTRKLSKQDRRQVDVKITAKGMELLAQIDVKMAMWETALHHVSAKEAATLNQLLDKLRG